MKRWLQNRISRSLRSEVERRLVPDRRADDYTAGHWKRCLADAGVELERVVHVRSDTRGVFVTRHPDFGRCVLKTISDTQHPHRAFTQFAVAQWLLEERTPAFPEVLLTTSAYTLERYVEGRPFRQWLASDFTVDVVEDYFIALRTLRPPPGIYGWGEPMSAEELKAVSQDYVRKCLKHSHYFAFDRQILSSARMLRSSREVSRRLDRLWDACACAQVPRVLMCGDMGNINLIVESSPSRVVNVDYEFLSPGHWGFDVAYFLSSLAKWGDDPSAVALMQHAAFDGEQLSSSGQEFFIALTDVLSAVSRTVYGPVSTPALNR